MRVYKISNKLVEYYVRSNYKFKNVKFREIKARNIDKK